GRGVRRGFTAGEPRGGRRARRASAAATRGARPAVLPGLVGDSGRLGDGDHHNCRPQVHGPGQVSGAHPAGATTGMRPQSDEFDELLRRALRAAINPIKPADDGLDRIRTRLTAEYPVPIAWIMTVCSGAARRARGGLQGTWAGLQNQGAAAVERFRAALPSGGRPASALAITGLIAAAGVLALASLSPPPVGPAARVLF